MKRLIFGLLATSSLMTGCQQHPISSSATIKPALPEWVAFYSSTKPTVFYALTDTPVQSVGKPLGDIHRKIVPQGPNGWSTDMNNQMINIRKVKGIPVSKAVAVKTTTSNSYLKAIAQSTYPGFREKTSSLQFDEHTRIHWMSNRMVLPSTLPSVVVNFVDRAGKKLGDDNPKIMSAVTDRDEASRKPMYHIVITGSFSYGQHHANQLPMIVLADGSGGAFTNPADNAFNLIHLS